MTIASRTVPQNCRVMEGWPLERRRHFVKQKKRLKDTSIFPCQNPADCPPPPPPAAAAGCLPPPPPPDDKDYYDDVCPYATFQLQQQDVPCQQQQQQQQQMEGKFSTLYHSGYIQEGTYRSLGAPGDHVYSHLDNMQTFKLGQTIRRVSTGQWQVMK